MSRSEFRNPLACAAAWMASLTMTFAAGGASSALERVERRVLPRVDVARLLVEDAASTDLELPLRVGQPLATQFSPANSGTWDEVGRGDRRWRLHVVSEGARWIVLGFGRYHLPPGAALRVLDPAGRVLLGPYSGDAGHSGRLWLPPLSGESAVIDLFWPAHLAGRLPDLRLESVSHGYREPWGGAETETEQSGSAIDLSGGCNVDVNCPAGDDLQDAKRGVVQLLIAGSRLCTGSLINTTALDCRPYLLTAAHCLSSQADAAATLFRFAYEKSLCETGEAPTDRLLQGAHVLASHAPNDMTLLELDQEPPAEFLPYFNGWSRKSAPPSSTSCIHHPAGAPKKVSRDFDALTEGKEWGTSHWRVGDWEDGTTEPGSSGAPLFDAAGRIIGQLHGGTSSCVSTTWDEFGKLSAAWSGGGTAATRLAGWLDPLGTGATAVAGKDGSACRPPLERGLAPSRAEAVGRGARTVRALPRR